MAMAGSIQIVENSEEEDDSTLLINSSLSKKKTDYRSIQDPGGVYSNGGDGQSIGNHCHTKRPGAEVDARARRKLIIASILCLIFMTGEAVGGAIAHSLAVVTDAAHLLTDFASFMISLLAIYLATRPATKRMSFGWHRAEVMGALISVLMIWVVTGILVYMAILRIIEGDYEINAKIMLITAAVGVTFNLVMGLTLHQHSHGHLGHSHDHGSGSGSDSEPVSDVESEGGGSYSSQQSGHSHNINVKAAFIHVLGDFCQSLGVLIAAFLVYFKPEWKIADPICTFVFSIMVLLTTINILRDTLNVLMEGTPRGLDFNEVKSSFFEIKGVREVHNLRIWSLTMNKVALSVHLAIDTETDSQYVLKQASRLVRRRFNVHDVTLQVEEYCEDMQDCHECRDPED